jgi:hypothetical protein
MYSVYGNRHTHDSFTARPHTYVHTKKRVRRPKLKWDSSWNYMKDWDYVLTFGENDQALAESWYKLRLVDLSLRWRLYRVDRQGH